MLAYSSVHIGERPHLDHELNALCKWLDVKQSAPALSFLFLSSLSVAPVAQLRDVDEVYKRFQAARVEVLSSLDPASARLALQRLLPYPVRCLHPMTPWLYSSRSVMQSTQPFVGHSSLLPSYYGLHASCATLNGWATRASTGVCSHRERTFDVCQFQAYTAV